MFEKTAAPADPGYAAARASLELDAVLRAQLGLSGQSDSALGAAAMKHYRDAAAAGSADPLAKTQRAAADFPTRAEFERWAEEARRSVEMKP